MRTAAFVVAVALVAHLGFEARAESAPAAERSPRDVSEHLRRLVREFPSRDDERFIKIGGSSVVSRAFLHCFETEHVDLGGREDLRPTLERLSRGRRSPFGRRSEATAVGYNLRHVLGGRPPKILREVRAMNPRFALLFVGPNDVMGKNAEVFERRLEAAVSMLLGRGVLPILGSIPPRPRHPEIDRWVDRFNETMSRVAEDRALPYIDFHEAMSELPRSGLARDGVHPNVYRDGRRGRPCVLSAEGLEHGQNLRNLLVLEMLDALLRVTDAIEPDRTMARAEVSRRR